MRIIGIILLLCIAAAILKYVVIGLAMVLLIVILLGVVTAPAETFGLLLLGLFAQAIAHHPAPTLAVVAFLISLIVVRRPAGSKCSPEGDQILHQERSSRAP